MILDLSSSNLSRLSYESYLSLIEYDKDYKEDVYIPENRLNEILLKIKPSVWNKIKVLKLNNNILSTDIINKIINTLNKLNTKLNIIYFGMDTYIKYNDFDIKSFITLLSNENIKYIVINFSETEINFGETNRDKILLKIYNYNKNLINKIVLGYRSMIYHRINSIKILSTLEKQKYYDSLVYFYEKCNKKEKYDYDKNKYSIRLLSKNDLNYLGQCIYP